MRWQPLPRAKEMWQMCHYLVEFLCVRYMWFLAPSVIYDFRFRQLLMDYDDNDWGTAWSEVGA